MTELTDRTWRQYSGDFIYRFIGDEKAFVAFRYNKATGQFVNNPADVNIVRTQYAFGYFLTKNVMAKVEYVNQQYNNYLATEVKNGAMFKGLMFEGVVAF